MRFALLWPVLLLSQGCHSRRDLGLLRCDTFQGTPVGPVGRTNTLAARVADTAFDRRARGALVMAARAADDSSIIGIQAVAVLTDSSGGFYQAASSSLDAAVILELPHGQFHLRVRSIGFVGQSLQLTVRRGYIDTVALFLGRLTFACPD